jgi:hypothetical protein
MATVISAHSMSLDGFIVGPNDGGQRPLGDGGERLFAWYFNGDAAITVRIGDGEMTFKVSPASAQVVKEQGR